MICQSCVDGRESECLGKTKHKTWCDWQGYPHDTVILQAQFCKHLRATEDYCPTCGSNLAQDRDGGELPEHVGPTLPELEETLSAETQRDIEDNFRTNTETGYNNQDGVEKTKRAALPKRDKKTPKS